MCIYIYISIYLKHAHTSYIVDLVVREHIIVMLHLVIWLQGRSNCVYKDAHSTSSILTPRLSLGFPQLGITISHLFIPNYPTVCPRRSPLRTMSWTPWPRLVFALHGVATAAWYDSIASIRVFSPAQQEDAQSALAGSNGVQLADRSDSYI